MIFHIFAITTFVFVAFAEFLYIPDFMIEANILKLKAHCASQPMIQQQIEPMINKLFDKIVGEKND